MKKRFFKRVASIAIALTLMLGLFAVSEINAYAEEEHPTGLKEPVIEITDVSEEDFNEIVDESQKADVETFIEKSYKGTDAFWTQFSSPYYNYSFSRLNANQQKLYNDLYNRLFPLIDGGADLEYSSNYDLYLTPFVSYTGLSNDEAINVAFLLMYDTPELYYLNQFVGVFHNVSTGETGIRIGAYDNMYRGTQRAYYASQIKTKINWYLSQVSVSASAYEKEKKIHDLLCDNCYYGSFNTPYDQSCASVFLNPGGETVCAGYSEAFALLCYASGIPVMSITSAGHEWNQVKLGNYWYAVDVTWDETASYKYKHFNKSDSTMLSLGRADHTLEGFWSSVGRESCPYDWWDVKSGIYMHSHSYNNVTAGLCISNANVKDLDFQWLGYDYSTGGWLIISDWTYGNEWCSWNPGKTGTYLLLARARWHGADQWVTESVIGFNHKQCINGKCVISNQSGYLMGFSTFDNPNNTYRYEMQILDFNLLVSGYTYPWIYSTGRVNREGDNSEWIVWCPSRRSIYYVLFRIYDERGNVLDEESYGFST